jgi:hypothetical protein
MASTGTDDGQRREEDKGTTAHLGDNCSVEVCDEEIVLCQRNETKIKLDSVAIFKLQSSWSCVKQILNSKQQFQIQLSYDFDPEECIERKTCLQINKDGLIYIQNSFRDALSNTVKEQSTILLDQDQFRNLDRILRDISDEFWNSRPLIIDYNSDSDSCNASTENSVLENKRKFSDTRRRRRFIFRERLEQNE